MITDWLILAMLLVFGLTSLCVILFMSWAIKSSPNMDFVCSKCGVTDATNDCKCDKCGLPVILVVRK
jgi:hypothetical protein